MQPISWERLTAEFAALYSEPHARKATWLKHREVLGCLARMAPTPGEFDVVALALLIRQQSELVSPMTVNSKLIVVRCQLNYMAKQGYLDRNPWLVKNTGWFVRVPRPDPRQPGPKRHQSIAELARVFAQAAVEVERAPTPLAHFKARRLQALVAFTVFTGVRAKEALYVRRDEIELDRNVAWITEASRAYCKTEKSVRAVPVAPEAVALLRPWVESLTSTFAFPCLNKDRPWLYGSTCDRPVGQVKALGERAGVRDVTLLSLRHTFTTHARQLMQLSAEQVQTVLGHTSPETQYHYDEPDVDNVRKLAQRIRFNVIDPDGQRKDAS